MITNDCCLHFVLNVANQVALSLPLTRYCHLSLVAWRLRELRSWPCANTIRSCTVVPANNIRPEVLLESLKEEHVQLRSRSVRLPLCLKAASFDSRVQLRGCCQVAELGTGQVADVQAEAALKRQLE